ncbi:RluA family pseudouridine synthase [Bacillus salacetis]|uniref:Pseudouridine synthase n=1 Tax=Bacillus salacetis TaxID=2315464 RepID=A0A3A1QMC5_9BACI|nr:RluA family pseudouridine synthase [Bacillus salacetis]RIW27249.1 RluA family pseudouridine synthase [Bacillus salacetis]
MEWKISGGESGVDIKTFLNRQHISKRMLTDIKFAGGRIAVNEEEVTVRYSLETGDHLTVQFPPEPKSPNLKPENLDLAVVYEDKDILVVNKPPYMTTIPSREHPDGSLANAITGYYKRTGVDSAVHIVTRLDRDTSGLVLIAKHRHIHHLMSLQQKKREIKRSYEALAEGFFPNKEGTVNEPIGRKESSIIEREVRADGKAAVTHFQVVHQCEGFAHLKLSLETGRTHQIRVHMSHMGHPLLGDTLYGGDCGKMERQALHCFSLSFTQPITGTSLNFTAKLPNDMETLLV